MSKKRSRKKQEMKNKQIALFAEYCVIFILGCSALATVMICSLAYFSFHKEIKSFDLGIAFNHFNVSNKTYALQSMVYVFFEILERVATVFLALVALDVSIYSSGGNDDDLFKISKKRMFLRCLFICVAAVGSITLAYDQFLIKLINTNFDQSVINDRFIVMLWFTIVIAGVLCVCTHVRNLWKSVYTVIRIAIVLDILFMELISPDKLSAGFVIFSILHSILVIYIIVDILNSYGKIRRTKHMFKKIKEKKQ